MANSKRSASVLSDPEVLPRLLLLLLVKLGASSEEIGAALGVHPGSVRNLFPMRKIGKIVGGKE